MNSTDIIKRMKLIKSNYNKIKSNDGFALDNIKEEYEKFYSKVIYPFLNCEYYETDKIYTKYDRLEDEKQYIESLCLEIFELVA